MIAAAHISKRFGIIEAVKDVSVTIKKGEVFGLIGTNGAGKSTFLRMACGVLKPDSGSILIDEKSVYENPAAKSEIFFISDDQYFLPNANPLDMAQFYRNYYSGFDMARFLEMIGKFGLSRRRKINTFSKGMKKQLSAILGICANTKYLFCDEVFDGLDPQIRNTVNELLKSVVAGRKMTILVVSHYLEELGKICTDRGFLHRGRILPESVWEEMVSKNNEQAESFNAEKEGQQG